MCWFRYIPLIRLSSSLLPWPLANNILLDLLAHSKHHVMLIDLDVPIQTLFNAKELFLVAMFEAVTPSIWTQFSCFLVRMLGNPGPPLPTHLMLWAVASHLSSSTALFTSWIFYFFCSMTSAPCSPTHQGSFPLNGSSGRFRWRTFCFLRMLECVLIWTSLLFL